MQMNDSPNTPQGESDGSTGVPAKAPYAAPAIQTVDAELLELLGTNIPGCDTLNSTTD